MMRSARISRRRFIRRAGLLGAAAALLEACAPAPAPPASTAAPAPTVAPKPAAEPAKGAVEAKPTAAAPGAAAKPAGPDCEVVVAIFAAIPSMDPHMHTVRDTFQIVNLVFDSVLTRDLQTMKPTANLATEWKALDDLTWEFKLRPDVKFHDGTPLTSADVKFSIERIIRPEQKSPHRTNFAWIQSVETPDAQTFRLKTAAPTPTTLERMVALWVQPQKAISERGDTWAAENALGSGPYRFVNWDRAGGTCTLEANQAYWGTTKPSIRTVKFRVIPEKTTQLAELLSGGVHIVRNVAADQITSVNASNVAVVKSKPILRVAFTRMDSLGRAGETPLQKVEVRRAVNHAVDRKAIVDKVLGGQGLLIDGPLNPLHFGFDPTLKSPYDYNPDTAKRLLAEAGYPNGFEAEMYFYEEVEVVEAIMGYLGRVGIKLSLKDFRGQTGGVTELNRAGKVKDFYYQSWGSFSVFDADAIVYNFFHSSDPNAYNHTPELDRLIADARETIDEARRLALYKQIQQTIVDQAYWLPLYARYTIEGINKDLNYEPSADEYTYLAGASWKA